MREIRTSGSEGGARSTAIDLRGFRILDFQGYSAWLAG